MPTLLAPRDRLFSLIGKCFTDDEFDDLCFSFGIELDEITSDKSIFEKEHKTSSTLSTMDDLSEEVLYRIEVPANRYDLLCTEGLAMAMRSYLFPFDTTPVFIVLTEQQFSINVQDSVVPIRPYIFSAILKDISFDHHSYDSFIKYQDKLHQTIGRNRSMVAIGTHDLDQISAPFTYSGVPPHDISFIPLNKDVFINGKDLFAFYENDLKIKKFLPLLEGKPLFPLITDKNNIVCSLPPIINGEKSKITLKTKNIFIEVTSTDPIKGEAALHSITTTFSYYCKERFTIIPVQVEYPHESLGPFGKRIWSLSDFIPAEFELSLSEISMQLKTPVTFDEISEYLRKMMYSVKSVDHEKGLIRLLVPMNRTDIMHKCDVIEDIIVAYGFNRIPMTLPASFTMGSPYPLNKLSDLLRVEMALSGFTEVLTLTLCSLDDLIINLNKDLAFSNEIVTVANPKSSETQAVRNTLLPGLLKTLSSNKAISLPISLFEISDVVIKGDFKEPTGNIGAQNHRRLAALYAGITSGFEIIHSALDRLMLMLSIRRTFNEDSMEGEFTLKESISPTFIRGRYASIFVSSELVGEIGVIHPTVLENFGISHAVSYFEISLEAIMKLNKYLA